jgi:hypothetical protein
VGVVAAAAGEQKQREEDGAHGAEPSAVELTPANDLAGLRGV